jgi:transposase
MDLLHPRCAGLDISKRDAKCCVRIAGIGRRRATSTVTTWSATTPRILELRDHLVEAGVTRVLMEATSDYWKPFYFLLEGGPFEVMLVNARHVKAIPGRKTDVSDAAWLAELGAHGLVRPSFVPPEPIRELRDLTRTRADLVRERAREVQRLEKLLEDTGIKLSSVASDITGISGRAMLEALIAGEHDPAVLADLAKRRLRSKIPELTEALEGRFRAHHGFLCRVHLDLIDNSTRAIEAIGARIEEMVAPFRSLRDLLVTIPGVSVAVADVIIAECGGDLQTTFPTAEHLASWAGVCPGNNESAGRQKSTHTRPGNPYLKAALGVAAMSVARSKGTYFAAKYRRIAARRGPMKAIVALEHAILIAVWNMCATGSFYADLGEDHFTKLDPERAKHRALAQLRQMGYEVTLQPLEATA